MLEEYGGGPPCEMEETLSAKIEPELELSDLEINRDERKVLRMLARNVAAIAERPGMEERKDLWYRHNALEKVRPLIFCDPENGWNEIITERQMVCKNRLARIWEHELRKEIFWGEEMGDDRPSSLSFDVPIIHRPEDWGLSKNIIESGNGHAGAYNWESPIKNITEDVHKVRFQGVHIDWKTSDRCLEVANDVLGDILNVRRKGFWWWSLGVTVRAVFLRSMTDMLMDFYDHPDEIKLLFQRISDGLMEKLDFLEENALLSLNNDDSYVGSGGFGYSRELGSSKSLRSFVRCEDLWGFAESQETVNVSPEMYEEFIFPYEKPLLDRFGLNCYGCCEPMDTRWHVVKKHRNLRRVSCSPWADIEKMSRELKSNYILSVKYMPTDIALKNIDEDRIRAGLRNILEITKDNVVEIIMKDNHTIGGNPKNVVDWCRIAGEEIRRIYG